MFYAQWAQHTVSKLESDLELHTVDGVFTEFEVVTATPLQFAVIIPHELGTDPEAFGQVDGNAEAPESRCSIHFLY